MEPRLSLVTLGVADVQLSAAFYERLGWRRSSASNDNVAFFQLGPVVLSLYGRAALLEDAAMNEGGGVGGVTLAQNVDSPDEVVRVLAAAVAVGARLLKPGQPVFWGGFSGYFADPDGHPWEVAHNPFFPRNAYGHVVLPV